MLRCYQRRTPLCHHRSMNRLPRVAMMMLRRCQPSLRHYRPSKRHPVRASGMIGHCMRTTCPVCWAVSDIVPPIMQSFHIRRPIICAHLVIKCDAVKGGFRTSRRWCEGEGIKVKFGVHKWKRCLRTRSRERAILVSRGCRRVVNTGAACGWRRNTHLSEGTDKAEPDGPILVRCQQDVQS